MNFENHDTQQQQQHSSSSTNVNTASLKDDAQDLQMAQVLMSLKQVQPRYSIEDIYETIFNDQQFDFDEFVCEQDDDENYNHSRKRFRKRNPKFADYDHYDYSDDQSYPAQIFSNLQNPSHQISSKNSQGRVPHWGGYGPRCPRQPMHDVTHVQHVKEIICGNNEVQKRIQTPSLPKIQNLRELRDRLDNMTKALSAIPPVSGNDLITPYKLVSVHPQNIPPVFQPALPTLQQLTSLANNFPPFSQYSCIPPTFQQCTFSTPKKQLKSKQNSFKVQQTSSFQRSFYDSTTPVKRQRINVNDEGENSSMFQREGGEKIEDSWQSSLNIKQNNQFFDKSDITQQQFQQQQQNQIETPNKLQQQSSSSTLKFNTCMTETPKLAELTLLQQQINKELLDQSTNPIGQCKLDEFFCVDNITQQFGDQSHLGNKPVKQIFGMLKRGLINVGDVVEYHGKKDCDVKARGEITVEGIKCWRCKGVVGTSFFENHCAGSTLRRPAENIYIIKQDLKQKVLLQSLIDDLNPEKMKKRQKRWQEKQLMMLQVGNSH